MKLKDILIFLLCLCIFSCDIFNDLFKNKEKEKDIEPYYKAKIIWVSDLFSNDYGSQILDHDSIFFYECPPGYNKVNIYTLTRLDLETGAFIWRSSVLFNNITFCQPQVANGYVYVLRGQNMILCFDRETGEHTATVSLDIQKKDPILQWEFAAVYKDYLYLSLYSGGEYKVFFVRLDLNTINHAGDSQAVQYLIPEILWARKDYLYITANPVIYNNTVFTATDASEKQMAELAGFDIDTKEMVFHCSFGGPEDINMYNPLYTRCDSVNPILIHDNILYYIGDTIGAWDLKSGEKLYRHAMNFAIPEPERYSSDCYQPLYHKGKIYFTCLAAYTPNSHRNIHCINAETGKLIWNTIAVGSESIYSNPILAHGKLYVPQYNGFRVYDPETGKLLGVDKTFMGAGMGRNILYKDLMICIKKDTINDGRLVAVDVSK